MDRTKNKLIGKIGEDEAAKFLQKKGYVIVERNWGSKWGEIDIIAKDKDVTIFVEVKTKKGMDFGSPEEMVGPRKLNQIQRMANTYYQAANSPKRIDVVAIVLSWDLAIERINHYEAVY